MHITAQLPPPSPKWAFSGQRQGWKTPRGPLAVYCFCVCSGSALLGDLLGVSRSRERDLSVLLIYPRFFLLRIYLRLSLCFCVVFLCTFYCVYIVFYIFCCLVRFNKWMNEYCVLSRFILLYVDECWLLWFSCQYLPPPRPTVWPHLFCGAGHEKRRESSWSGPWHLGCTSEVFHVHSYRDQFIRPGWAECFCVSIFCLCLCFACLFVLFGLFVSPFFCVSLGSWVISLSVLVASVTNENEPSSYWMGDVHHCSGLSSPEWPILCWVGCSAVPYHTIPYLALMLILQSNWAH